MTREMRFWLYPAAIPRLFFVIALLFVGSTAVLTRPVDAANSPPSLDLSINPSQPLSVPVESRLLEGVGKPGFFVLLNNYDVTPFVSRVRDTLQIALDTPLQQGDYILQIRWLEARSSSETVFERRLSLHPTTSKTSGELLGNVFYRAQESDKADFAGTVRTLSDAALRLQAERANFRSSLTVSADIQFRSDTSELVSGDKAALPNYLLEARTRFGPGQLRFAAGHQKIGWEDHLPGGLVLDQFRRRGVSVGLASASGHNAVTLFTSSSEPLVSINENVLFASNRSERSSGALLNFSPFSAAPEKLQLSATYLDGRSLLTGTGIDYATGLFDTRELAYGGETSSIAVSSTWLEGALRLAAEQAFSDFDPDGLDNGESKRKDSARSWWISAGSEGRWVPSGQGALGIQRWGAYLRRQIVGPDYYSMGNIGLPGDLDTREVSFDASGITWQLQSSWISATNNVDNRPFLPQQKVTERLISAQFSPEYEIHNADSAHWLRRALGKPALGLRLKLSDRYQPLEDALITGQELDDETLEYALTLDWVKPGSQWRFEYSAVEYDNAASLDVLGNTLLFAPISDSRNRFATLQFSIQPTQNFTVSPLVQWSRFNEKDTAGAQQLLNYGLQSSIRWLDGRVTTAINYANNSQKSTASFGVATTQRYGNSQFDVLNTWQALLPTGRYPGINLSLRGSWNVNRSSLQRNNARYQVLLGLQIHWRSGR